MEADRRRQRAVDAGSLAVAAHAPPASPHNVGRVQGAKSVDSGQLPQCGTLQLPLSRLQHGPGGWLIMSVLTFGPSVEPVVLAPCRSDTGRSDRSFPSDVAAPVDQLRRT